MKNPINMFHVFTKTAWHCFVGCVEFIGIPTFLAYLSTFLAPINESNCIWQWIERIAFCFTIFEVIIIGILKMKIDTRKDALNALKTAYEIAALYCESGDTAIVNELNTKIEKVLNNGVLNQLDIIKEYGFLKKYIAEKNISAIRYKIISCQHSIETAGLLWNYTLLLRWFK